MLRAAARETFQANIHTVIGIEVFEAIDTLLILDSSVCRELTNFHIPAV
jgi:hypothetical protein